MHLYFKRSNTCKYWQTTRNGERMVNLHWERETGEHQWPDPIFTLAFQDSNWCLLTLWLLNIWLLSPVIPPSAQVLKEEQWSWETSASKMKDLVICQPWQKHLFLPTSPESSCCSQNLPFLLSDPLPREHKEIRLFMNTHTHCDCSW